MTEDRKLGLYKDPKNGDLWRLTADGWTWINGANWRFVPKDLVWVGYDALTKPDGS